MSLEVKSPQLSPLLGPESFSCEVQPERGAVRVLALGSLDVATAPALEGQLGEVRDAGFQHLIIDLSRLDFMDSTGLHLLLRWDADARQDGYLVEIVPGPPAVQRVFELTGTSTVLPFTSR